MPPEFTVCLYLSHWSGTYLENGPASQCEVDGLEELKVPGCSEEADNPLRASQSFIPYPHLCLTQDCSRCWFYSPGGVALLHQVKLATSALSRSFPSRWWASTTNSGKDFTNKIMQETRPQESQRMRLCIWQPTQNEEIEITFSQGTSFWVPSR